MYRRLGSVFALAIVLPVFIAACGGSASPPTPAPTPTPTRGPNPSASPGPTTAPTPPATPTAAAAPQAPTAIHLAYKDETSGPYTLTITATWKAEAAPGTTVKVYGVNKCLATAQGDPCAIDGMTIPVADLLPLASAPAGDGTATWGYWAPEGASYFCGAVGVVADKGQTAARDHWYWAVVLRAESAAGSSPFAVAVASDNVDVTC